MLLGRLAIACVISLRLFSLSCEAEAQDLQISWADRYLTIEGQFPGEKIRIHYLEAYCRPGSTDRDWSETVIPHKSELVQASNNGKTIKLLDRLSDGVLVEHVIRAEVGRVDFHVVAKNPTMKKSEVAWAQPCVRVDRFTGRDPKNSWDVFPPYVRQCFLLIEGTVQRLPTRPWALDARYTPGQVYCPMHVPLDDVNPRPLSPLRPSHGLCGCYSADNEWILGMTWEPFQEIFQGVITCIHNDFRIGGLEPGESKTIRGVMYLHNGSMDALLERYRKDFPEQATGLKLKKKDLGTAPPGH